MSQKILPFEVQLRFTNLFVITRPSGFFCLWNKSVRNNPNTSPYQILGGTSKCRKELVYN